MADHFDGVPDPRHDITDLYAFQKPGDATKSIFIINVNPAAPTLATHFDPEASYELKIDTNDDAEPDLAVHVVFTPFNDGQQTATVYLADGESARRSGRIGDVIVRDAPVCFGSSVRITTDGDYRFYAGLRSDPFFVDPPGFFNGFQWSGSDANIDKNVFGIVLELPNRALGAQPRVSVWARTVALVHGEPHQMDMAGRPFSTNAFNASPEDQHTFNGTPPSQQRDRFLANYVAAFENCGYDAEEAHRLALEWLPITLPYDYTSAQGYPNGRNLTDDMADMLATLITQGQVTPDLLGPHTDLLDAFPYLGPPHPYELFANTQTQA